MKISYIHDEFINSEKANVIQVIQMCNAFSEIGHEVTLVTPKINGLKKYDKIINDKLNRNSNISIRTYRKIMIKNNFNMLGGYIGIKQLIKNLDADLCFVRNPIFINLTIGQGIKTIFESHNCMIHEKLPIIDALWKRNLVKNAKHKNFIKFVSISNNLSKIWELRGIPSKKLITLHDGFDSQNYSNINKCNHVRNTLGLPLNKKIILYAGSLYENRGIENILNLAKAFPESLFVLLGGPIGRKEYYITSSIKQGIKNILFTGHIPHKSVKQYLIAADVLLMIWTRHVKTINYCSPLKMFEYMAAGRIIVGHAFPTIKEVLKNGETAFLSNPSSYQDLKKNLKLALGLKYPNEMADKARNTAFKYYTWTARAQSIMDSIKKNCIQ